MSEFLDHKKIIDPKEWIDKIPPKWRMPAALGAPALLIICMIPLLFREDKAKGIDRNTVSHLATDIRTQEHAQAVHEAQLSAALAARLRADNPGGQTGAGYGAAASAGAPTSAGAKAAAASAMTPPPGFDPNAPPGSDASASGGGGDQPMDQPHLQKAGANAASGGTGAAGGPAAAGKTAQAKTAAASGGAQAALKPMAKPGLKAFNWSGAGHGAGANALGGGALGSGASGLATQANSVVNTSQYSAGAGSGGSGGGSAGSSGGAGGGAAAGGGGSKGSTMGASAAGQSGSSGGAPLNFGGQNSQIQQCMDTQNRDNPKIKSKQADMKTWVDYRTNNDCRNTACYYCTGNEWWYNQPIYISWRNHYCPCAAARCHATEDCNAINQLSCEVAKACPGGQCQPMDCAMNSQ